MALFVAKNGQLQTIKGIFECKNMLREGVDYETADWLKADIPFEVRMMDLPINSSNIKFDIERLSLGNIQIFKTENADYFFWERNFVIGVYDIINHKDFTSKPYPDNTTLFHIRTTETSVKFNNIEIGVYGFPIKYFRISCLTGSTYRIDVITKISSIEVDGVTRYVPCQLLRDIPATLDANGKARVAGECGMYDAVSGKFFGNVASTGSFTVVND
jgi:hypothetical protein